ncbi:ABC transporter ATP-binding protein [Paraburkholderia sp. RL17-373-BIF-A]|jgi:branched-chain amino acid transport system ATP-binding protein|uniref:ABC transporter ATP-binding protein n=1 Tax=Paraburkholderia sp. RL17-373-BIF-A TaxID=3031629 RepID=UPI0038BBC5B0
MLEVDDLSVSYGPVRALSNVSLKVERGQLVGILGANGAGKTSLLRTISGLVRAKSGAIRFDGSDIGKTRPERIVRMGIAHVPEGRGMFPDLTVRENLLAGAHTRQQRGEIADDYAKMLEMFPSLARREKQDSSTLSGGEQQMLAIARAMMSRPRLLLADEVSLGLAPVITKQVFAHLQSLRDAGITVVVVEQNAHLLLKMADHVYVLRHGRVELQGSAQAMSSHPELTKAYMGE